MQALSRSVPLADDVSLNDISKLCEHYSGADLKALLYNAQLEAIHSLTLVEAASKDVDPNNDSKAVHIKGGQHQIVDEVSLIGKVYCFNVNNDS